MYVGERLYESVWVNVSGSIELQSDAEDNAGKESQDSERGHASFYVCQ